MGRRTSSGRIGAPTFGGLLADAQTITSDENTDIILDPTGTGIVKVDGHLQMQNTSELRFADQDATNYVGFKSATTVLSNVTWTLPDEDGTAGQALVTDGNESLSFSSIGINVAEETTDSDDHYLVFTKTTSGTLNTANVNTGDLVFVPSTGILSVANIDVAAGSLDNVSIGANTAGSGAFTTLSTSGNSTFNGNIASNLTPSANNTYDLGTAANKWRNIYTNDLHLSNGIGDYTVVEGEEDLFLYNNKNGKIFKFALIEVDASEAPPKNKED